MKLIHLAVFLLAVAAFETASARKVVCYYSSWAVYYADSHKVAPSDIDPGLCTHINYAFVAINGDGSLKTEDEYADITLNGFRGTTGLKSRNGNLKVLLSIGGASAPSQTFAQIAADAGKRAAMIGSARWFVETYGFDGIDMDWEVPNGGDRGNFAQLLQEFKNDFSRNGWLVTAAVSADPSDGYDVPRLNGILDHVNIMTYDMYGPWSSYTGQNSALYPSHVESQWEKDNLNMQAAVRNWQNAGLSPEKIIPGIAFYGHSFTLQDPNNNGLHAPITGAGQGGPVVNEEGSWTYFEFCADKAWNCVWDDEQKMIYCTKGNQWLGIDETGTVTNKAQFIKNSNLGGAMIWSIDQDDVRGNCGGSWPLLRTINNNIN